MKVTKSLAPHKVNSLQWFTNIHMDWFSNFCALLLLWVGVLFCVVYRTNNFDKMMNVEIELPCH
jgi:hypothetical protein